MNLKKYVDENLEDDILAVQLAIFQNDNLVDYNVIEFNQDQEVFERKIQLDKTLNDLYDSYKEEDNLIVYVQFYNDEEVAEEEDVNDLNWEEENSYHFYLDNLEIENK